MSERAEALVVIFYVIVNNVNLRSGNELYLNNIEM